VRYPTRRAPLPVRRARQLLLIEASIHSLRHSSLTCFQISPRATPQLSSPTPHAESHRTASVASKAKLSCRSEPTRLARLDSEEIPELPEYLRDLIHKPAEQQPSYELIEQTPPAAEQPCLLVCGKDTPAVHVSPLAAAVQQAKQRVSALVSGPAAAAIDQYVEALFRQHTAGLLARLAELEAREQ
jgi:hypothetical protein